MRLIGSLFKSIIGIVSSFVIIGCGHVKEEEVRSYYGPAPVPPHTQKRDLTQSDNHYHQIDEPPSTIYGPPGTLGLKSDPSPEVVKSPSSNGYPGRLEPPPVKLTQGMDEETEEYPLDLRINHPIPGYNVAPLRTKEEQQGNNSESDSTQEQEPTKPIVDDIVGDYKTTEATLLSVTKNKDYRTIKLSVNDMNGVKVGSVGEIYIGDQVVENGRFKITKIEGKNCFAITNATANQIKNATRSIVKIPVE